MLYADISVDEPFEQVRIQRLVRLVNPPRTPAADDEVHPYRVTLRSMPGVEARFTHRYGDGALVCLEKGLTAMRLKLQTPVQSGAAHE